MNKKILAIIITAGLILGIGVVVFALNRPDNESATSMSSKDTEQTDTNDSGQNTSRLAINQRDTQRKNNLSLAMAGIQNYRANNRGALPQDYAVFRDEYLLANGNEFSDPSSDTVYEFVSNTTSEPSWGREGDRGDIYYAVGYECDPSGDGIAQNNSSRSIALRIALEAGGSYCTD